MAASLVDLLLAAAVHAPDKVALRRQRAGWTYAELTRGAAAAATALVTAGLQPGDRVGLLFRNGPEYVAFFYGALAARLAAVPLNVQERASVLALQVAHSGARLVVGDPDHPEWQALRAALPADFPMLPVPSRDMRNPQRHSWWNWAYAPISRSSRQAWRETIWPCCSTHRAPPDGPRA